MSLSNSTAGQKGGFPDQSPEKRGCQSQIGGSWNGGAELAAPLQGSHPVANGRGQRAKGTGRRAARRHSRLGKWRAKLCSACAGDYENPEMTAPEGPLAENASAGGLEANTRGGPSEWELAHGGEYFPGTRWDRTAGDASWSGAAASPEPLERLAASIEQLGRLTALEEQFVREIVRVTRDVVAAREPAF